MGAVGREPSGNAVIRDCGIAEWNDVGVVDEGQRRIGEAHRCQVSIRNCRSNEGVVEEGVEVERIVMSR